MWKLYDSKSGLNARCPRMSHCMAFRTIKYLSNTCCVLKDTHWVFIQCVPLATEPGICLIILPLMRILQWNLKQTTDTFLFISHTMNVLLFKFHCNIFIGVRIITEMPGLVASGTPYIRINAKGWVLLSRMMQSVSWASVYNQIPWNGEVFEHSPDFHHVTFTPLQC